MNEKNTQNVKEIEELRAKIEDQNCRNEENEAEIEALKSKNNDLENNLYESNDKLKETSTVLNLKNDELENTKLELEALKKALTLKDNQVNELEKTKEALQKELESLKEDMESQKNDLDEKKSNIENLEEERSVMHEQLQSVTTESERYLQELDELRAQILQNSRNQSQLLNDIKALQDKLEEAEKNNLDLHNQNEKYREIEKDLHQKLEDMKAQLISSSEQSSMEYSSLKSEKTEEIEALNHQLGENLTLCTNLKIEKSKHELIIQQMSQELEEMKKEYEACISKGDTAITELKIQILDQKKKHDLYKKKVRARLHRILSQYQESKEIILFLKAYQK